jgi:hypothetical protein
VVGLNFELLFKCTCYFGLLCLHSIGGSGPDITSVANSNVVSNLYRVGRDGPQCCCFKKKGLNQKLPLTVIWPLRTIPGQSRLSDGAVTDIVEEQLVHSNPTCRQMWLSGSDKDVSSSSNWCLMLVREVCGVGVSVGQTKLLVHICLHRPSHLLGSPRPVGQLVRWADLSQGLTAPEKAHRQN